MKITVTVECETSGTEEVADDIRFAIVNILDNAVPYMADNHIVTSNIEG